MSLVSTGGGGFGAPEDGKDSEYVEGDKDVEKAVADRRAKWVKEHSSATAKAGGGSVARYTSEQESA